MARDLVFRAKNLNFVHKLKVMDTNIAKIIQSRLEIMGMSQAQFAQCVSATPSQVGIFLKEKGSLSTDSLNKGLGIVGINLSMYSSRNELAKEVAEFLISKSVSSIDNWSKSDLASFCKRKEICVFFDVESEEQFLSLVKSGLIDVESTFPYFKSLVSYYMYLVGETPTSSQAKHALSNLTNHAIDPAFDLVGLMAPSPILRGILALASKTRSKQNGAITLFVKSDKGSLFAKALEFLRK